MCGICGIVSFAGAPDPARRGRAESMLRVLGHRGPDEVRLEDSPSAVFGATRLAIRGLDSGSQPLVDAETGVLAVCNGEIDNHVELRAWLAGRGRRVALDTDIAVVAPLYLECGDAFVERLIGAFAVAIWDPRSRRLLLARDRAGERPLFYAPRGDEALFASEVAAAVADAATPLTPGREAIAHYLRYGCFAAPWTSFLELKRVPPGEVVALDGSGATARRYWRLGIAESVKVEPSLDRFDEVFRRAVLRQSEVDVPFGVFLSGGVDSSLVAAVMKAVRPGHRFGAYTVRFGEASYDEGAFAERAARGLGIPLASVRLEAGDFPKRIAKLVALAGEPLGDPAWVPASALASRAAEDVKVVLVGEGADEIFGGYPTYIGARISERWRRVPAPLRVLVERAVRAWPVSDRKVTISFLLKRFLDGAGLEGMERHRLWTSSVPPELLARLGVADPGTWGPAPGGADLLDLVQLHDLETSLAEGLLTKADRAGMQSSLELRAPFLDKDVMEFAATLPASERVRGVTTKVFLKRFALRYLPRGIVHRKKRGLSVPLASWLRGTLHDWARERLASPRLAGVGVDPRAALAILDEHRASAADRSRAIWTVVVLSEWLEWLAGRPRTGAP